MTAGPIVGTVAQLWRFPVKSMQGEPIDRSELGQRGLRGDRAYALIDTGTGKVASAKSVKMFPNLLECRAAFVEPPGPGGELPPVRVSLPDGTSVTGDTLDVDRVLSKFFRREVRMIRAAPEDFTIDMYQPDQEAFVEQKLGAAFFAQAGLPSPVPVGAFFDLFPVSVLTTSTLERLAGHRPGTRFDPRRFRMNVIVATEGAGFVENEWIGRAVAIGDAVRLRVAVPDARCVMTTLPQGDLARDIEVLRTLTEHNRVQVGAGGRFPCAGVYAVVEAPGSIRKGDRVALA